MSEALGLAAFRHTEMAIELAVLRAVVSSANYTFHLEVIGELVAEF
jgi:hypothetical protein